MAEAIERADQWVAEELGFDIDDYEHEAKPVKYDPKPQVVKKQVIVEKIVEVDRGIGDRLPSPYKTTANDLLYDLELKMEIQFNLMPKCKKYFQFKNGAYNLATEKLEERTRDMYITCEGILNYDYPKTDDNYDKEIKKIDKIMKMIHPDPKMLEAFKMWRGYCLTGEINEQIFFIFLGESASNGKSTCCVKRINREII